MLELALCCLYCCHWQQTAWLLIKERKMHLSWLLTRLHRVRSMVSPSPSPQLCGGLCSAGCWCWFLPRQLPRSLHRIWSRLGENEAKCLRATRRKSPTYIDNLRVAPSCRITEQVVQYGLGCRWWMISSGQRLLIVSVFAKPCDDDWSNGMPRTMGIKYGGKSGLRAPIGIT